MIYNMIKENFMAIRNELEKIFEQVKGEKVTLSDEMTFDELGFDSLDKMDIIMRIEETFNVSFGDDVNIPTVGDLIKKLEK